MGNSLADIRLVFFVGQGTGGFAYGTEVVSGIVTVVDCFFHIIQMAVLTVLQHFQ